MRVITLVGLLLGMNLLLAQDKKVDPHQAVEPRSGPGEGQQYLEKFVGDFDVAKLVHRRGGGEPSKSTGECKQTMIQGGRFLQSDFIFGTGKDRTTGMGLTGFEPSSGRFTSVWIDSRQTKMSFRQAKEKFDGAQIVLYSQSLGGDNEGRRSKTITRLEDSGNKIVHRQYNQNADGTEQLFMELILTRKPSAR